MREKPKRKRFYKTVSVTFSEADNAYLVLLDDRQIRTPARSQQLIPNEALANALADEWQAQADEINPELMPLTRLVNTALDGIAGSENMVRADIVQYAGSDLLCYRAEEPQALIDQQSVAWDPVLEWVRVTFGAQLKQTPSLRHVPQNPTALDAIAMALDQEDAFSLAALHVLTTLTGSAILALAARKGFQKPQDIWEMAHVDENWQISRWGNDDEASDRRKKRFLEFSAAIRLLALIAK